LRIRHSLLQSAAPDNFGSSKKYYSSTRNRHIGLASYLIFIYLKSMLITIIVFLASSISTSNAESDRWFEISSKCKPANCSGSGHRSQRAACVTFEYNECSIEDGKPILTQKRETFRRRLLDYWTGDLGRHRQACAEQLVDVRKELTQNHHRERPLGTCTGLLRR